MEIRVRSKIWDYYTEGCKFAQTPIYKLEYKQRIIQSLLSEIPPPLMMATEDEEGEIVFVGNSHIAEIFLDFLNDGFYIEFEDQKNVKFSKLPNQTKKWLRRFGLFHYHLITGPDKEKGIELWLSVHSVGK